MTVVYLDSVFFLNGAMDYLLLLSAATLAGIPLRRRRYILMALLGGAYAVAVFLPGLEGLSSLPAKAAAGVLMGVIAFSGEERVWRLMLLTFAVACAMAGSVLGLSLLAGVKVPAAGGIFYTDVSVSTLLPAAAGAYLVIRVVFRAAARRSLQGMLLPVTLCIGGRKRDLTALWDSGNGLRNPVDGRPVLVAAPGIVEELLPRAVGQLLTQAALRRPAELLEPLMQAAPGLRPQLLPYRAVGAVGELLVTIRCDWVEIGGRRYEKLMIALSPNALGDGYSALWGGEAGKGGRYETLAMAETMVGDAAAPGGTALHRRQRHAAAPFEPGAGSGAAGTYRGRAGPVRADRT